LVANLEVILPNDDLKAAAKCLKNGGGQVRCSTSFLSASYRDRDFTGNS